MATNYIQEGKTITYANTGTAIVSGQVVVIGNSLAVALGDIAATSGSGSVMVDGVFELPKTAGASSAIAFGTLPIWDVSAGKFVKAGTSPATGDVSGAAFCVEAAVDADTVVRVKLLLGNGTVT